MPRRHKKFRPHALRSRRGGGDWSSESCVVVTCASIYRRLEDSAHLGPRAEVAEHRMSDALDLCSQLLEPGFFQKAERLVKSESEDSGVEMGSTENSVFTPLGSVNSFHQEGPTVSPTPSIAEPHNLSSAPDSLNLSLTASTKLKEVMQRSKKLGGLERSPSRLPPFSVMQKHSGSLPSLSSELLGRDGESSARQRRRPSFNIRTLSDDPDTLALIRRRAWREQHTQEEGENLQLLPGPGLRYLEHVCQMLEKIAHLQQYNLRLQQERAVLETQNLGTENDRILETCVSGEVGHLCPLKKDPPLQPDKTQEAQNPCMASHSLGTSTLNTGTGQGLYKIPDMESLHSEKTPVNYTHSLSLQDERRAPDFTHLSYAKYKHQISQWDKVKALITKLAGKTSTETLGHPFNDPLQVLCV
ncbi:uncharacterized protein C8orf58 homolog isoform X2 [Microcaecilia unicolor]|uniref:Uncharacterized protein C8orf58 homolog isoform X2 n=1 Tax=Microcaecilia unicolor TaxID=1415580 RepID=A0A6P7XR84_9AMPH|nr:uncharacterized protein C8orf58 homolog isoform X2 [Microcaecilia unicolor]